MLAQYSLTMLLQVKRAMIRCYILCVISYIIIMGFPVHMSVLLLVRA